jgi:hypothetical protein
MANAAVQWPAGGARHGGKQQRRDERMENLPAADRDNDDGGQTSPDSADLFRLRAL